MLRKGDFKINDKEYNKLVRDKIPEIIIKSNKECIVHIADDKEYIEMLHEKLIEEFREFSANPIEEEMADIFEVIDSLIKVYKMDKKKIEEIKYKKKIERGSFNNRIILEKVIE